MKKKINVAVSGFALPAPRRGSIDSYSGFGAAAVTGIEIHQRIQAQRLEEGEGYRPEVPTSFTFERGDYIFEVGGRIDGIFEGTPPKIEEIKSSFNIYELQRRLSENRGQHPYCLQVRTYGYIHWRMTGQKPELSLLLVSSRNGETIDFKVALDIASYEAWLELRLEELVIEAKLAEKRSKRRKTAAKALMFPFAAPRAGQTELIATLEQGMGENRPMLVQAPTGLGKTVGVLYPVLREALSRGQRALYVTPKNSQHAAAEDAVERLQAAGANLKSMTLTAKSKMCFKNEPICNPDFCEFAKDHYSKVADNQLIEKLAKKKLLTARSFKKMAAEFEVCPFELQLDGAREADAIICDYNYVFAPTSALNRLSGIELDQEGKPNLVIDEAHNLPSRAMDYYSPALSVAALEKMRADANKLAPRFRRDAIALIDECMAIIKSCSPAKTTQACKIKPPIAAFVAQDVKLRNFLSEYLKSDIEIEPKDVVLGICFYWGDFTAALEFITQGREEFFTTFSPSPMQVKITCCDASEMLRDNYKDYSQIVGFSATLKPFDYYSRLSGLAGRDLKTAEFSSPFKKSNRKLLVIPQISSKYSDRERNYPRIAEAISKIAGVKRGNYFAFFPSFDFMNRVFECLIEPAGFEKIRQFSGMQRDAISEVIEKLKEPHSANIVFAVQGGVFSEGVDYPGDMIIGAFVVGPPLPNFDLMREEMRQYYQQRYAAGFDYAYTYPAMAKSVQAAGRVIRSETDRGIVVLMDSRFIQPSYAKSMPGDWFDQSPRELVSENIIDDVKQFWQEPAVQNQSL